MALKGVCADGSPTVCCLWLTHCSVRVIDSGALRHQASDAFRQQARRHLVSYRAVMPQRVIEEGRPLWLERDEDELPTATEDDTQVIPVVDGWFARPNEDLDP